MIVECYGGGTAMGAVQVFTAERLRVSHGLPAEVHGTSVGALTAACRASDQLDTLRDIWSEQIRGWQSFQTFNFPDLWRGLFSLGPLRRKIRRVLDPRHLQIPCYVHMVDLGTKRYERVLLNGLSADGMEDALVASASQPGIHEPAKVGGRWKGDGGIRHVMPIPEDAVGRISELWAVSCSPITHPSQDHQLRQSEIPVTRGLEIAIDTIERTDYRLLRKWVERGMQVWLVQPSERPGNPFNASHEVNLWRLDIVGADMWRDRTEVLPRDGLHLDSDQAAALRARLSSQGMSLDDLLREI